MQNLLRRIPGNKIDRLSIVLVVAGIVGFGALMFVAATRTLTSLEQVLFQVLILGASIMASWRIGRNSAMSAAQETVRLHTRPAFRRVLDLYISLGRLSDRIREYKAEDPDNRLNVIEAIVDEQLGTMDSALEDWRDIIPEDVEEIAARIERAGGIGR